MKYLMIVGALGAAAALQACGRAEDQGAEPPAGSALEAPASAPATGSAPGAAEANAGPFSTTGQVTAVEGSSVTISHQAVEGLGWPAMTMSFEARDAVMLDGVQPGTNVEFAFRREGDRYVLTELRRR